MTGRALSVGAALVLGCASSAPPPSESIASSGLSGEDANAENPGGLPENLGAEHIAPVVAQLTPRLRAKCWQPALNAPGQSASSLRFVMRLTVESSGTVSSAEAQGVPRSFVMLPGCIATVFRSVKFPQATNMTHVVIPYAFDAK